MVTRDVDGSLGGRAVLEVELVRGAVGAEAPFDDGDGDGDGGEIATAHEAGLRVIACA